MNVYNNILKAFLKKDIFNSYNSNLNYNYIKENYPELNKLFHTIRLVQEKDPKDYSLDDLELAFYSNYPQSKKEIYSPIFEGLRSSTADESSVRGFLESAQQRERATGLARIALEFAEGKADEARLAEAINNIKQPFDIPSDGTEENLFVTDDLEELHHALRGVPGLRWRLDSLNKHLGSLRAGNFGLVFARPETGKTTFLASEVTHMASQTDRPILWLNNEEKGEKVAVRCYQAALDLSLTELYSDVPRYRDQYRDITNQNLKIFDKGIIDKKEVEELCRKFNPALIIFDQIDKVTGFEADRYDLKMKAIYAWARELAKIYGPVIGVCQAGSTGENKKWLTMNDVDSSHTAKQGELDWILGIGKTFEDGLEEVRYLHLSKNKLDGDEDTLPDERHGKWEVKIDSVRARYTDF
jgi:replicative DNA helicase